MEKVIFNGVELTKYITVARGFTLNIGANFEPKLNSYISDGSEFAYTRKKEKEIPVPFYNKTGSFEEYNALQKALNVNEPKELKFSSWPNKVFYATPVGSLDFAALARANGKGTLTFIVADGLAHSTVGRTFSFAKNADGILETTIVNNGSEAVPVDYTVKFSKESGYLGIVSQYGGMQFGKREEADGKIEVKNVTLTNNKSGNFSNWTNGTVFYESQGKKSVTTMSSDTEIGGRLGVLPSSFSNTANGAKFGAIKEIVLSQNSKNWYLWSRAMFETSRIDQTGAMCLAIIDTNNNLLAAMAIEKNTTSQNRATVHFIMGDGSGGARAVKSIPFTPNSKIALNPYGEESRAQGRNMFDIRKVGDKVTFFWYGSYHTYAESRIKDLEAKRIQFFVGQYAGQESNKLVARTYINDLSFQKLGVETWRNIPNRYPTGSTLRVDGMRGELFVNEKIELDDEIRGTKYFKVPPGETKVQILVSSFSEVANATAEIKEAFI